MPNAPTAAALSLAEQVALYGRRRQDLITETEQVRVRLAELIRAATADGMRQVDIVKATGYTREQVRVIQAGRTR